MKSQSTPFLDQLSKYLFEKYQDGFSEICIILPNRRAGLFFRKYLAGLISKPLWMPDMFSSQDFVFHVSGLRQTDAAGLLFQLYEIHKKIKDREAESLGDFIRWAQTLAGDFDEADQYLADPDVMYKNLAQLKEIENWSLGEPRLTDFQKQFIAFWESMSLYYRGLKEGLLLKKLAYPGLAYRLVAENPGDFLNQQRWSRYIFAGFNALNKAEEKIISFLVKEKKAEVIWDADAYYLENPIQEAGFFLRKYRKLFPIPGSNDNHESSYQWKSNSLSTNPKEISVIGAPGRIAQASVAGSLVSEWIGKGYRQDDIAIVLSDERLLFPVLNFLPASVSDINVTMGYPMKNTPVPSFINALFSLQEHVSERKGSVYFYHRDIRKLLLHPFTTLLTGNNSMARIGILNRLHARNYIYCSQKELLSLASESGLENGHLLELLFTQWKDTGEGMESLLKLFGTFGRTENTGEGNNNGNDEKRMQEEYLAAVVRVLRRVQELSRASGYIDSIKTLGMLVKQMLRSVSLPFYGEPLAGLQVMGMLETRALDFRHVILISANENVLPSPRTQNSFIPMDVRKAYGLPVYRDRDAVFAYHFYRLIQRAETIHLLYNTDQYLFGKGEKSRFITQLIHELPAVNRDVIIKEKLYSPALEVPGKKIIAIEKNRDVMKILIEKSRSGLSPTMLASFINCPLQFYFRCIAGLKESEETAETIGADVLGTAIHEVLQKMFAPFIGKSIGETDLDSLRNKTEPFLIAAFENFFSKEELKYGKNMLTFSVALRRIHSYLEMEKEALILAKRSGSEAIIHGLELPLSAELEVNGEKILLKGIADKVEFIAGCTRITDYKTGLVKPEELRPLNLESVLIEKELNKSFQLLMYAWLYARQYKTTQPVVAGIISFRSLKSGLKLLEINKESLLDAGLLKSYTGMLKTLLERIFDQNKPFDQTQDERTCAYCSFKSICNK